TGGAIFYMILTLQYTVNKRNGHIIKIFVQMLGAMLLVVVIDFALGFSGWSFNIGIPLIILLLDVVILICMVINHENWQTYLLMQVFTIIMSIIHMVLYLAGRVTGPVIPWVTFGVSTVIFTSCLVIGGKKAENELKRKFYI
ncbi:MAG TPA: zinc ribbon domain-containing protein, partial [Lachnospiraceae bacterium]|nr:zinc ribbon domain-containing protein [Lachnospiraceae bacterium]